MHHSNHMACGFFGIYSIFFSTNASFMNAQRQNQTGLDNLLVVMVFIPEIDLLLMSEVGLTDPFFKRSLH